MNLEIKEISEILGLCRPLRLPKYVLVTDERIYEQRNGRSYFRGLQPKNRRDILILGSDADSTTVPHELWHCVTGLGEASAYPIGRMMARKNQLVSMFPRLRGLLRRDAEYREISSSPDVPNLEKYSGRIKLYELSKSP